MATSALSLLISAAKLAEDLSAGRQKEIAVVLTSRGPRVEGRLWTRDHHPLFGSEFELSWHQIEDGQADILDAGIREVSDRLEEAWRKQALEGQAM